MLPLMSISIGWRILILYINILNVEVGNDSMNESTRLSLEHSCWFVIWLCVDLKDSLHLHIRVIMALTHLSKIGP